MLPGYFEDLVQVPKFFRNQICIPWDLTQEMLCLTVTPDMSKQQQTLASVAMGSKQMFGVGKL